MGKVLISSLLLFSLIFLSSCQVVGGIFKAGVWSGIFLVVIVVGIIIFIATRLGSKK